MDFGERKGTLRIWQGFETRGVYLEVRLWNIIPSQMEVAPLHCTVDITQKRRLLKNTKEIEKM